MKPLPIVALIGPTNAGKSSLLNRLARQNIAIVAREEGTTRDNVVAKVDRSFILVDTAGLKKPEDTFEAQIQDQIEDAVESAALILLTLDSTKYPGDREKAIARTALRSRKPVFLLLNKSDLGDSLPETEFLRLGIKPHDTFRLSATTGAGTTDLKHAILEQLNISAPAKASENLPSTKPPLTIALVGRPNVGKSSLFNSLAKKQQALVSSRQGTTRDVNRLNIRFKNRDLEILDTAGLRRPGRREVGIEKFSAIRSLAAIEESDISALLIDATEPHAKLDQALAGEIIKAGKGIIIVLTKTDLVANTDSILDDLEHDFNFLPYAPVLKTSSETGLNVTKLFELAEEIDASRRTQLKTSDLNKILSAAIIDHPPAGLKNTRPKPKYIVQTDSCPPWFVVHGHNLSLLHWSWKRYLERRLREAYPFIGTPIIISYRED